MDLKVCVNARGHSSMMGEGFEKRAAGFLLKKELQYFAKVICNFYYEITIMIL